MSSTGSYTSSYVPSESSSHYVPSESSSHYVPSESSSHYVPSESSSIYPIASEDYDFNYTVTRQKIYSYNDYSKIVILLFIIMLAIYLMVVFNKFN